MKLYVSAGFGRPLGLQVLQEIERMGFRGVRQDVPDWADAGHIQELALDFIKGPPRLRPLWLLNDNPSPDRVRVQLRQLVAVCRQFGLEADVEVGNECDAGHRWGNTPGKFREALLAAGEVDRPAWMRLVSGGITTTDRKRLDWLAAADPKSTPVDVIGFHSYRADRLPVEAHPGYDHRTAEFEHLRRIAGGKPLWNTEVGWHTVTTTSGTWPFRRRVRFTDEQVAQNLQVEAEILRDHDVEVMTVFQLNDGPGTDHESHYGLRRLDGSWKPSAHAVSSLGA